MVKWVKTDLKVHALQALSRNHLVKHGLYNTAPIGNVLNAYFSGREIHDTLIWSLLVFKIWFDLYMDGNEGCAR